MKAEYIDHMGDDLMVVNSARVSFDKESDWIRGQCECCARSDNECICGAWDGDLDELPEKDKGLIKYLARHNHWTPFSHPQITLREKVPIFVARQRFKHMVGFTYNEVSRRYVDDEPEFYVPEVWRSRPDGSVKQGSSDVPTPQLKKPLLAMDGHGSMKQSFEIAQLYDHLTEQSRRLYEGMIESGVAPEQARMVLPQSMYTSYYVTGSLAAFARAYKQRIDDHAQQEIQELAKQWDEIIQPLFPESWKALTGD